MTIAPSKVKYRCAFSKKRRQAADGRNSAGGCHRNVALVFTLLTFCPPGPLLRLNVHFKSSAEMLNPSLI